MEFKEDFGLLVRRIVYSNSGQFMAFGADGRPIKERASVPENKEWNRYKEMAESAARNGNYAQAESMWLHALAEAKHNERDPRLAYTLENLASLYYSLGRYEQAEMFCIRAIDVLQRIYGHIHVRTANCLNNLAGIYYDQARCREAEPICQRVLDAYEGIYGPDHADVGMAVNNLAMILHVLADLMKLKSCTNGRTVFEPKRSATTIQS